MTVFEMLERNRDITWVEGRLGNMMSMFMCPVGCLRGYDEVELCMRLI